MYKIFDINIHEMLSMKMVEPTPDHSSIILAIVPLDEQKVRPMVLFWSGEEWIDDRGNSRPFDLWTYISVGTKE